MFHLEGIRAVAITARNPEIAARSNAKPPTIVSARTAEWLVGIKRFVLDVVDDIRPLGNTLKVFTDLEPHHDVTIAFVEVRFAAVAVIFVR